MDNKEALNKDCNALALGLLLIWRGFTEPVDFFPKSGGWVGVGLFLLGVNPALSSKGIRLDGFSISIGLIVFVAGGRELIRSLAAHPLILSGLAIVLIGLGALMPTPNFRRN